MSIASLPLDGTLERQFQGGAITLGNFDGVHRGHQALLAELRARSTSQCSSAVAVTFSRHPLELLRPAAFQPLLTTLEDRVAHLQQYGADHVVVLETTPELLHLTPEEFFQQIIVQKLRACVIVEGANFGFGRNRAGNVSTLKALGPPSHIDVVLVPDVQLRAQPVSSSRVRNELVAGNVSLAREMLGRPFRVTGTVRPGQRRGQSLGFPTANLAEIATLIPGNGVYAVQVFHAGKPWPGAVNIGPNPTFGETQRKVEVHLIGFSGDLYGQKLSIDFVERLRDTRPFAGVEELKTQLAADVAKASEILGRR